MADAGEQQLGSKKLGSMLEGPTWYSPWPDEKREGAASRERNTACRRTRAERERTADIVRDGK
jgi:hypothetical protein